jgi:GT2 family glycosyltransferase
MPPRVTVVITQRERMSLTERSLESVLSDRSEPFDLIYVDGGSSEELRRYLQTKSQAAQFLLLQRPEWLWPNVARNLAMTHVKTEYVVFIDNDVLVEQGWLQRMVQAADETGAALVGPLYLWSNGVDEPRIHMAGGVLNFERTKDGLEIFERHNLINERLEVRSKLVRSPCDYLEYHCMMARTDFLTTVGGLDEQITCVHEHIDLALEARKRNLPIVMEPTAGVDYLAFIPLALSDVAFYQWRWSQEAVTSSLSAFCRKWQSNENGLSLKDVRNFTVKHRDAASLFATGLQGVTSETALSHHDVRQTLFELMKQAFVRGYSRDDVSLFGKAYNVAMTLFGDGFRPCGRPFLLHLVGTASVLIAYGFTARVVVCGMLHAAYSHAPVGQLKSASLDAVKRMLQSSFEDRVELTIREYTRFRLDPAAWCNQRPGGPRTLDDAAVIAIGLANDIDEHFSGEYLFSHKRESKCEWRDYAFRTVEALSVPGLALSLSAASSTSVPEGFLVRGKFNSSFRIRKSNAVPMEHGGFETWDSERHGTTGVGSSAFSLAG